ncbi:hypothetical protein F5X96DRAFT_445792 [Biscogniauxia mediterranea]|nr:hypothetical protein F5X96DRAFT_445792 [Biscogniauxia mediterranea]
MGDQPIVSVPPPWKLKATAYVVTFWSPYGKPLGQAYSPLERESTFAAPESGQHLGGISQIQIIRYSESPVGPYDELLLWPGSFSYDIEGEDGRRKRKSNARITRIYVSQKETCWNGRKHWNIPKHLARFEWEDLPDGSTAVKVFPNDTTGDVLESRASDTPLVEAKFQRMRFLPKFPFSLGWFKYVGMDLAFVQPPLPEGRGSHNELPGTERWCRIAPVQSSKAAMLMWGDVTLRDEEASTGSNTQKEMGVFPGLGGLQLSVKLEDVDMELGAGEHWDAPRTNL